jgi:hypothetical protein
MRGYGRGYYGEEQLAKEPRRGSGWGKIALVVGVGAVVWLMWPRKSSPVYVVGDAAKPPAPPSPLLPEALPATALPAASSVVLPSQIALPPASLQTPQTAEARGYASQQAYEDAVVATARQLQATGAQITLAPHLAHLAPRLA